MVDLAGEPHTRLTIERRHNGGERSEWWYQATNKDYLQVFTPFGSLLERLEGNDSLTITPVVDYATVGYEVDPDLKALEGSDAVFGKTVFPAWLITESGEIDKLDLRYQNPKPLPLEDGALYTFIFELQSGARGKLEFSIRAPLGFKFREADNSKAEPEKIFRYSSESPPGRVIVRLVLVEDRR